MKKVLFILMTAMITFSFMACNGCKKAQDPNEAQDTTSVAENSAKFDVEHQIATDRQYMGMHYRAYRWYETCILLKNYLDSEDQDGEIAGMSNIFYVLTETEEGADGMAVQIAHTATGNDTIEIQHGLWIEDFDMSEEPIKVTYEQAYERVMAANYPKPHSRHCVLRKEVGPKKANAQYIFGNLQSQLYVDAVTGDVSDKDPAFGDFGKPLGEWP